MKTLNRYEAWAKALEVCGEWRTWDRAAHIAYGLLRGRPYSVMERCANDAPPTYKVYRLLCQMGGFLDPPSPPGPSYDEMRDLIVWVRKPVRVRALKASDAA